MNVARYGIGGTTGAAIAACLLLACPPASADEKTVLQLRWDHQFQFAGYYAALWQGYYREAGLDVEIRSAFEPDGRFHSVTREVAEGRADFGTGAADILVARDKGAPLMVLASVYQRSPVAFYAKAELGLESPADLTRLRVATLGGSGFASVELRAMLRAENIDPALVPQQRIQGRLGLHDLAKGVADVATGFTISADWVARNLGLRLTSLRPAAYGVDFYGEALFSHRRLVDDDPGMVQRFVAASLKGWDYALTHPEQIADRIARELPRKVPIEDLRGFNRFQIERVRKLIQYPIVELGHTNPNRWGRMHEALRDAGVIAHPFDPDDLIFDAERIERQRFERIGRIILVFLGVIVVMAIAGWVWTLRRSLAGRVRAEETLRESKQRFQDFAESTADWFWELDANLRYVYVSPNVESMVGRPPEWYYGKTHEELLGEDYDHEVWDGLLEALREHRPFRDYVFRRDQRWENPGWTSVSGAPVFADDGSFLGFRGSASDITEQKRAEEAVRVRDGRLRELQAELLHASRLSEMGQFSSALAHELSQPLTAIMNYLQACRRLLDAEDAASPETTRELMQKAFDQSLRASGVIRSLRGLVEKKEGERAALEINPVVEEATNLGRIGSSSAKLHVALDLGIDLPPVLIDKIQIQQVVLNLVRNGIEAMAESARRELTIKSARSAQDWIEVSVGDTGAGLSEEVAEQLFQPFVTTKAEGMGIGLSISHSIVAAHGGRLWATPNPDGGTVFHFTVPVAPKGDGGDVP